MHARENISDLLLDATTYCVGNDCGGGGGHGQHDQQHHDHHEQQQLDKRSHCLHDLLGGMVDIVFHKYSSSLSSSSHGAEKLTFSEFCDFVRDDATIQSFVRILPTCLGHNSGGDGNSAVPAVLNTSSGYL
jgi:hypothetical protein